MPALIITIIIISLILLPPYYVSLVNGTSYYYGWRKHILIHTLRRRYAITIIFT